MSYEEEQQCLLALWEASERDDFSPDVECEISDEDLPSEHSDHNTESAQFDPEINGHNLDTWQSVPEVEKADTSVASAIY